MTFRENFHKEFVRIRSLHKRDQRTLFGCCESLTIDPGMILYRVREEGKISDTEDDPFGPPPRKYQGNGRFDAHSSILYLATSENLALTEGRMRTGDKYALLTYKAIKPIKLARPFIRNSNFIVNSMTGTVISGLSAAINDKEFTKSEKGNIITYTADEDDNNCLLEMLRIGIDYRPVYKYTNWIYDNLRAIYPNGVAYPSSFDFTAIQMNDVRTQLVDEYNIALDINAYKKYFTTGKMLRNKITDETYDFHNGINTIISVAKEGSNENSIQ